MFKQGTYEKYVARMLDKPHVKPLFEEYYILYGRYPSYYIDSTEDEALEEIKRLITKAKTRIEQY